MAAASHQQHQAAPAFHRGRCLPFGLAARVFDCEPAELALLIFDGCLTAAVVDGRVSVAPQPHQAWGVAMAVGLAWLRLGSHRHKALAWMHAGSNVALLIQGGRRRWEPTRNRASVRQRRAELRLVNRGAA